MTVTIEEVRAAFGDPDMEVREHPASEMRILLMLCSRPFVGGRRWACHADGHVWMGFTEQEALEEALAAAPYVRYIEQGTRSVCLRRKPDGWHVASSMGGVLATLGSTLSAVEANRIADRYVGTGQSPLDGLPRKSPRGVLLAYQGPLHDVPVLTCELALDWKDLYLVMPDGTVTGAAESAEWKHNFAFPPEVFRKLAEQRGWHREEVSFHLIMGRWEADCNP